MEVLTKEQISLKMRVAKWKEKKASQGLCEDCGKNPIQGKVSCKECREKRLNHVRRLKGFKPWRPGKPGRPPIHR